MADMICFSRVASEGQNIYTITGSGCDGGFAQNEKFQLDLSSNFPFVDLPSIVLIHANPSFVLSILD